MQRLGQNLFRSSEFSFWLSARRMSRTTSGFLNGGEDDRERASVVGVYRRESWLTKK